MILSYDHYAPRADGAEAHELRCRYQYSMTAVYAAYHYDAADCRRRLHFVGEMVTVVSLLAMAARAARLSASGLESFRRIAATR